MPPKKSGITPVRNVRIPEDIWRPALAKAQARGETITAVIERALQAYLADGSGLTVSTDQRYGVSTPSERKPNMLTITEALTAAGIDMATITRTPDGVITVTRIDGSRFAVGEDGEDEAGVQWWTGTQYSPEDDIANTDSWTSLESMADTVAAWEA